MEKKEGLKALEEWFNAPDTEEEDSTSDIESTKEEDISSAALCRLKRVMEKIESAASRKLARILDVVQQRCVDRFEVLWKVKKKRKILLYMNCGGGKTITVFHMILKSGLLESRKYPVVSFVPHLTALRSFMDSWLREFVCGYYNNGVFVKNRTKIAVLIVGSKIVGDGDSDEFKHIFNGLEVFVVNTTNPDKINSWYNTNVDGVTLCLVFSRYCSGHLLRHLRFAASVFDEAHKIVGLKKNETTGELRMYPSVYLKTQAELKIAMTGTRKHVESHISAN